MKERKNETITHLLVCSPSCLDPVKDRAWNRNYCTTTSSNCYTSTSWDGTSSAPSRRGRRPSQGVTGTDRGSASAPRSPNSPCTPPRRGSGAGAWTRGRRRCCSCRARAPRTRMGRRSSRDWRGTTSPPRRACSRTGWDAARTDPYCIRTTLTSNRRRSNVPRDVRDLP